MGYLVPKPSLWKNSSGTGEGEIRFLTFSKGISLKVIVIAWLEFELTFYNVTIQHINHYTTGTPLPSILI